MARIERLADVVDWRLCLGCGACEYICPEDEVELLDFLAEGIRPVVRGDDCGGCRDCLDVCPGVRSDYRLGSPPESAGLDPQDGLLDEWGPIVGIWEGFATDPEIRFKGSSGGVLTALSAYCIERVGMHGVLQIAPHPDDPVRSQTRLSRERGDLLEATGSRYAPASVCNGLGLLEGAPSPCAVIGKPSEIAGLRNAMRMRPELARKVGVALSFFCAETPSTQATRSLVEKMGADPDRLADLRYRGLGWPGHFAPTPLGRSEPIGRMTYQESWAILQSSRPWATHLWPDGSGELADISCGDPWYEAPDGTNPGFSLVVARNELGRRIVEGAMAEGYVDLRPAEAWKLRRSQRGLLRRKSIIEGRRLASRLLRAPITSLPGLELGRLWQRLSWRERLQTVLGTLRRMVSRRYMKRSTLDRTRALPVHRPRSQVRP